MTRAVNAPATGTPVISGTVRVGETLTASVDDIEDATGGLVALEHAQVSALVPVDSDSATHDRVQAAFEAMAPSTRRAYGTALTTWGRWAAAQELSGLSPSPADLRRYLQERAANGSGISSLTIFVAARRMARAGAPTHEIMAQRWHGRRLHPGRKRGAGREVAGVMPPFPDYNSGPTRAR